MASTTKTTTTTTELPTRLELAERDGEAMALRSKAAYLTAQLRLGQPNDATAQELTAEISALTGKASEISTQVDADRQALADRDAQTRDAVSLTAAREAAETQVQDVETQLAQARTTRADVEARLASGDLTLTAQDILLSELEITKLEAALPVVRQALAEARTKELPALAQAVTERLSTELDDTEATAAVDSAVSDVLAAAAPILADALARVGEIAARQQAAVSAAHAELTASDVVGYAQAHKRFTEAEKGYAAATARLREYGPSDAEGLRQRERYRSTLLDGELYAAPIADVVPTFDGTVKIDGAQVYAASVAQTRATIAQRVGAELAKLAR